jgi:hypothetical protein
MIHKSTFAIFFSMLLLFGCKKDSDLCDLQKVDPGLFSFEIMMGGNLISDSTFLASMQLVCVNNSKPVEDLKVSDTIMTGKIVHRLISSKDFIKVGVPGYGFILSYRDNQGNNLYACTLVLNYDKPSSENNCQYFFQSFTLNNKVPPTDNALRIRSPGSNVYILNIE